MKYRAEERQELQAMMDERFGEGAVDVGLGADGGSFTFDAPGHLVKEITSVLRRYYEDPVVRGELDLELGA